MKLKWYHALPLLFGTFSGCSRAPQVPQNLVPTRVFSATANERYAVHKKVLYNQGIFGDVLEIHYDFRGNADVAGWDVVAFFKLMEYNPLNKKAKIKKDAFEVGKSNEGNGVLDTLFFDDDGNGTLDKFIIPPKSNRKSLEKLSDGNSVAV